MKPFMGNPCMRGRCMRTDCENCYYYTPTCFGVRVPKWLGNILFRFEAWLCRPSKRKLKKQGVRKF